jgi:hypothetical protein
MGIRLIGNKRIELTDDEFKIYQEICQSYSRANFDGKSLFNELFETDEEGLIVLLRPPKKMFSMEVVLFLQNLMLQQHLRKVYTEHYAAMDHMKKMFDDVEKQLLELKESRAENK